jgi:acetoin utilization protein AcuB
MKAMPRIEKVMTVMPMTIGKRISIAQAQKMMREHQIRHLPVQDGARLLGVLTERDIRLAQSLKDASELLVEDVMTPDPYQVQPSALLDDVCEEMAEFKYGCAIVTQTNGKVVGIFTAIDALRYLSENMREHYQAS